MFKSTSNALSLLDNSPKSPFPSPHSPPNPPSVVCLLYTPGNPVLGKPVTHLELKIIWIHNSFIILEYIQRGGCCGPGAEEFAAPGSERRNGNHRRIRQRRQLILHVRNIKEHNNKQNSQDISICSQCCGSGSGLFGSPGSGF